MCVYYDAWKKDNNNDPLASIISEIAIQTNTEYHFRKNDNLINLAKGLLQSVVKYKCDYEIPDNLGIEPTYDYLEIAKKQDEVYKKINEYITELLSEKYERLIIIIDELDRCRPNFAVELLERIKHYFDDERLMFVFATNLEQLQYTVKKYYGNDFDGYSYLDRFFDIKLSIPEADFEKYDKALGVSDTLWVYFKMCRSFADYYELGLRERNKYLNISKIAGYYVTRNSNEMRFGDKNALEFSVMYIVPLLLILKFIDIEKYSSFVKGNNGEDIQILKRIAPDEDNFIHYLFDNDEKNISDPLKKQKTVSEKLNEVYKALFVVDKNVEKTIGSCEFSRRIGKEIIDISNIMSEFTPYNT